MCNIPSDLPLISTQVINKVFESIDWSKNLNLPKLGQRGNHSTSLSKSNKENSKFKNGRFYGGGDFYIYHPSILTPKDLK